VQSPIGIAPFSSIVTSSTLLDAKDGEPTTETVIESTYFTPTIFDAIVVRYK
jgi:hypothetical protein